MDTSIQRLLKMKKFLSWVNTHTSIEKKFKEGWSNPFHLENNGPQIKVHSIFLFSVIIFTLCFHQQLWVKWVCRYIYILEIVTDILGKLIRDSPNVSRCFTLNEIHIKLTSLIICLINDNITNTSSTPPPEVKKNSTLYVAYLIILCTAAEISIYWKFKDKTFNLFYVPNQHNCCVTVLWKFL